MNADASQVAMYTFVLVSQDGKATPPYVFDDFLNRNAAVAFAQDLLSADPGYSAVEVAYKNSKLFRVERQI